MPLATGTRLGPYEIVSPIGAGGMGEVYKARDTRLDRMVAVKVLPQNFAGRMDFRQRFEREARAISSLSHPHICPLYDVGNQDGVEFLVMESLEGETLAQRLKQGPLTLERVLRHAVEIAGALDHAHRHGVVHRDLKPGNVMLTAQGAKVLDFGLAKVRGGAVEQSSSAVATAMMMEPVTADGAIVGTMQYMAPEQLEGKEADARADIFAFGALVYEMATGRRAFEGSSPASLIAAILERQPPPMATLQPMTPGVLDHLVRVCLAKDPEERWQSAADLTRELKWISSGEPASGSQATPAVAPAKKRRSRTPLIALACVLVVGVAALSGWLWRNKAGAPAAGIALGRTTQVTFETGLVLDPVISPDGKLIAYAEGTLGTTHLYVRQLGASRSIALTKDMPGNQRWPQWSPDGSKIAFHSLGGGRPDLRGISVIAALGGPIKRLVDKGRTPAWSPDGTRIAYSEGNAVYVYSLSQGQSNKIAEHPFATHSAAWSPDGARIAYVVENPNFLFGTPWIGNIAPSAIWVVNAAGGKPAQVTDRVHMNMSPAWLPDSRHLVYVSNQSGRRDLFELELRSTGEPASPPVLLTTGLNAMNVSVSRDGTRLAYSVLNHEANIWSIPIPEHPPVSAASAVSVTTGNQTIEGISVSKDEQWLAFDSSRNGNQDIYRMPLRGGEIGQLTTN